jgi:hypothetical protein
MLLVEAMGAGDRLEEGDARQVQTDDNDGPQRPDCHPVKPVSGRLNFRAGSDVKA